MRSLRGHLLPVITLVFWLCGLCRAIPSVTTRRTLTPSELRAVVRARQFQPARRSAVELRAGAYRAQVNRKRQDGECPPYVRAFQMLLILLSQDLLELCFPFELTHYFLVQTEPHCLQSAVKHAVLAATNLKYTARPQITTQRRAASAPATKSLVQCLAARANLRRVQQGNAVWNAIKLVATSVQGSLAVSSYQLLHLKS